MVLKKKKINGLAKRKKNVSVYFKTAHQRRAFTQAGLLGQLVAVLRARKAAR